MRKNRTFYKGRYFDYYMGQRAAYPYDKWIWRWGIVALMRGRTIYTTIGEGAERPDPKKVFPNLLTK